MNLNGVNSLNLSSEERTMSSGFALLFNGTSGYVTLGAMGAFGSTIQANDGFYVSFDIKTTATTAKLIMGKREASAADLIEVSLNTGAVQGLVRISVGDSAKDTSGDFTNTNVIDGSWHTITFQVTLSTNTIVATLDGVGQTVTIQEAETPNNVINFVREFFVGAKNVNGSPSGLFPGSIDNLKIGTSSSVLFGIYTMDEGTGSTITDTSGQNNTGTLSGSTPPSFVTR